LATKSTAHEIRPGYLRVVQIDKELYEITWKIPKSQNRYLDLSPSFDIDHTLELVHERSLHDALIRKYDLISSEDLKGTRMMIINLEKTLVDVLVQIDFLDDLSYTFMLQPSESSKIIPKEWSKWEVVKTYIFLGIEHILLGYDHLLFVLGLILIIPGIKTLIKTITSFTIAHSITLIFASLGLINVPSNPVEAVIALSIVLLAKEAYSKSNGQKSLTINYPWIVAFIFGLIHGLGFAGALSEIGLPQKSIPTALFTFNIGVELGQLAFILIVGSILYFIRAKQPKLNRALMKCIPYFIGSVASFWLIERILGF